MRAPRRDVHLLCTSDPSLAFAVDISVSVVGCAGTYSVEILQGLTYIGCPTLPPGGGFLIRIAADSPRSNVNLTFNLRTGAACGGAVIGSVDRVVSTPPRCGPAGAPADGVPADADVPTLTF